MRHTRWIVLGLGGVLGLPGERLFLSASAQAVIPGGDGATGLALGGSPGSVEITSVLPPPPATVRIGRAN